MSVFIFKTPSIKFCLELFRENQTYLFHASSFGQIRYLVLVKSSNKLFLTGPSKNSSKKGKISSASM